MKIEKNTKYLLKIISVIVLGLAILSLSITNNVPDFTNYQAGAERKKEFFNYFLPLIKEHNTEILKSRSKIIAWSQDIESINWLDHFQLDSVLETYQLDRFDIDNDEDFTILLRRVDTVPVSLALAQAVNESGWGTSRFVREGNNYYGEWCFIEGCGIIPKQRTKGEIHEVAIFNSPEDSIESYLLNLNTHKAYKPLREIRASLRAADKPITGIKLARGLNKYSQRGDDYIDELRSIIRHNNLRQYDANN